LGTAKEIVYGYYIDCEGYEMAAPSMKLTAIFLNFFSGKLKN
jgi:hypothetical protein